MNWVSVDPGANGCIIVWEDKTPTQVIMLCDVLGRKDELNRLALPQLLHVEFAVIEKVRGMTHDSAASAFNFGWVCGILHQYFAVTHYVSPQEWQNAMHRGLPKVMKPKLRSKTIAEKLYGDFVKQNDLTLQKHDGAWDALLLGGYWIWKKKRIG